MSNYPTEEEEFEMLCDDELEIEKEMERESQAVEEPIPEEILSQTTLPGTPVQLPSCSSSSIVDQPIRQLNRKLFDSPYPTNPRTSSTPFSNAPAMPTTSTQLSQEIFRSGFGARKRCLEELFGDIQDIDDIDDRNIETIIAKRQKTEEEIDLEMIERILELRKQRVVEVNAAKFDDLDQLEALQKFKEQNLSSSIPKYPFIPIRSDGDRIYVRFHSEDFESERIREIQCGKSFGSIMSVAAKEQMWALAQKMVGDRMTATASIPDVVVTTDNLIDSNLWVEKYRPKKYLDLLSDESTNRNLLKWLKMWDKIVFQRDVDIKSLKKQTVQFQQFQKFRRKERNTLKTDYDEHGRPMQKIALLCGPPGLGKTTLAHTIARHAGYNIVEINASDDRTPEAFKLALENGTQMKSFLAKDNRPNCIILDEIDGAPVQSIDFLLKFVGEKVVQTSNVKGKGKAKQLLRRPIICICNDMYVPALRQLRQIAFVVSFPQMESGRLADRLHMICRRENITADFSSLLALAEKSGNDVRSCLSMLQFFASVGKPLTIIDVLKSNIGQKDMQKGLFTIWEAIFQIQRPRRTLKDHDNEIANSEQMVSMTDTSAKSRVANVLHVLHMNGDYSRLMNGVFENYLKQKMPDANMTGVAEGADWFCFSDRVNQFINHKQNYSVYSYMQYGFVAWHLLFASMAWPKIAFPKQGYEFTQKANVHKAIESSLKKGFCATTRGVGDGPCVILDTVSLLRKVISPSLRTVSVELLSPKERSDLKHAVDVMVDLGLTYIQIKSQDGTFQYRLEPDIEILCNFETANKHHMNYFSRQIISREVEVEKMRRAGPKFKNNENRSAKSTNCGKENVPNHLRTLNPKSIQQAQQVTKQISKDIFGRVSTKSVPISVQDGGTDVIIKSSIWYKYKEGFNNAVRKDVTINHLL
ncbi:chromosome transmission fidelity protein 18 homolog [Bradysia coprophila]|uniref:chromosome transmission fidelity protein 18 homolog n=1 Tax=Bradysia coprophila TaxID=38358 RepID=UPI00187DD7B1|nr:chromosome transmission fidelity protein 18 homolog [Bradysia coprophila]